MKRLTILCDSKFQLAADYRFAVCDLTEGVLSSVIKNYTKVADDTKILISKLLHTSLIVHNPEVDGLTSEYAANKATWHLHIRNMMHLVQNEILRLRNNRLANNVICEHFVLFASKLCSVVSIWKGSSWKFLILVLSFPAGILGFVCMGDNDKFRAAEQTSQAKRKIAGNHRSHRNKT